MKGRAVCFQLVSWICLGHAYTPNSAPLVPRWRLRTRIGPLLQRPLLSMSPSRSTTRLNLIKYEDLMEKLPSPTVVDAIDRMVSTSQKQVVASDVAATAGVSLSQARKDLTALASLARGDIAVDENGELIYTFPSGLKNVLSSNSAKYQVVAALRKAWPGIFWFIRASFGVTLLVSLFAVFSAIVFLQSSSSSSSDDNRDDRRGGGGGGIGFGGSYIWGPSPFDFLYWSRPYGYYSSPYQSPEEMGLLTSIFSYVFGDGDPNAQLEERRFSLVANLIRLNNGAVTAEQLAPFCDDAPDPQSFTSQQTVDESFVLPIVTALNGEPQVTPDGDIVYVFPDLQTSAVSANPVTEPSTAVQAVKEGILLRRAGLSSTASAGEIKSFLSWNGISTRGVLERSDLVGILEDVLPPLNESEQAQISNAVALARTDMIQEREYQFSVAPTINRYLAAGLGILNLGGAIYLGNLLAKYAFFGVQLPSYLGLVQSGYPFLLAYAILFNAIPAIRALWINRENAKIAARNQIRAQWKTALKSEGPWKRKLQAAARFGTRIRSPQNIIYDTKQSMEKMKQLSDQQALDEFDKKLRSDTD